MESWHNPWLFYHQHIHQGIQKTLKPKFNLFLKNSDFIFVTKYIFLDLTYETIGVDPMDLNMEPLGMNILTLHCKLFLIPGILEVINNNISSVPLLEPPCPPALAPAAPHTGLSPQPSSPKGSGSKAQPCPHCHREFTNLRHHINQQHMQVMCQQLWQF